MKKLFTILLILVSFWVNAQIDTKPTNSEFYGLQSPFNVSFYYNPIDSSYWAVHTKSGVKKWQKLGSASHKYSIWNHTGISNTGWSDGKVVKFNSAGDLVPGTTTGSGIGLGDLFGDSPISYNNTTGHFSIGTSYTVPTSIEKGHYDTAYGWGDHASAGYVTGTPWSGLYKGLGDSTATDGFTRRDRLASQIATREPKFTKNTGFNKNFGSTTGTVLEGRTFGSAANSAITDFEASLGNPSVNGYVLSSTTTGGRSWVANGSGGSMVYPGAGIAVSTGSAWGTSITNNSANWNTAYGWGNHANAGYLTSYTETDPVVKAITGLVKSNGTTIAAVVSGTDIKTINSTSLLGSGNISIAPMVYPGAGIPVSTGTAWSGTTWGVDYGCTYGENYKLSTSGGIYAFVSGGYSAIGHTHSGTYEPILGNPGTSGYVLSSTTGGTRSWVAQTTAYSLPLANGTGLRGGIQLGFTETGASLALQVAAEKAYITLTKSAIENVFTGAITTHTHNYAGLNGSSSNSFAALDYTISTCAITLQKTGTSLGFYNGSSWILTLATGGNLTATGTMTATNFILNSDRRLKQNIKPITFSNIDRVKFVQFDMKADSSHRTRYGVIAQDVEKIAPELVYTNEKGMKSVAYIDLLIAKIESLENRIKKLENEK